MSWAEVKKINSNMHVTLDELFLNYLSGGYRTYMYSSGSYTVPYTGLYTVRAYQGNDGAYGKVVGEFNAGETITASFSGNNSVAVSSSGKNTSEFSISLSPSASRVNGNSNSFVRGLSIGAAAQFNSDANRVKNAGSAYIRCNNGVSAGGGGYSSQISSQNVERYLANYNSPGGNAYAWGNNVYALGGGGGTLNNNTYTAPITPGYAFVNDEEITTTCSWSGFAQPTRSGRGSGRSGGCGAGGEYTIVGNHHIPGGSGCYGSGAMTGTGASARAPMQRSNYTALRGYFTGSDMFDAHNGRDGGTGGFYGGSVLSTYTYGNGTQNGGRGIYGIGGNSYVNGRGGDGLIFGGNSTYGVGGNGFFPGVGPNGNGNFTGYNFSLSARSVPDRTKNGHDSIVIIQYGDSPEEF